MWNQWSGSLPPMPPPTVTSQQQPLIGPVLPQQAPPSDPPPPAGPPAAVQAAAYAPPSGAPTYTPAQYAAMTPEQQYAVQQHWQQWQAYEQQYAQWHAQYGEQYKREMAAIHAAPPPGASQYNTAPAQTPYVNSYAFPPPAVSNPYQVPPAPAPAHVPPPPPPDDNSNAMGIKAPPQIYEQPPPPPPPPQHEEKMQNQNAPPAQFQGVAPIQGGNGQNQYRQNQDNQWSQPPPPMQNQGNRWGDSGSMGSQLERQQQNVAGAMQNQANRWNDGPQDRQQQGQFNQQFNNNNQRGNQQQQNQTRDQQRDDLSRNRQNNEFRGRTRGRGGNKRQQQSDGSEERNKKQQWQQTDGPGQRNNRGNFNNRFDNYDNYDRNVEQGSGQQGPSGWNNQCNNFSPVDNQRQQQNIQKQNAPIGNAQNNMKTSSGVDEKAFDEQFRLWEEQFENWKKENANHPDRTMYMQYEREFEKTRIRLLERREQMRRRKMMELEKTMPQQSHQQIQKPIPNQEQELQDECADQEYEREAEESKKQSDVLAPRLGQPSDMEQSENEESNPVTSGKQIEPKADVEVTGSAKNLEAVDTNVFRSKEITGLFKSTGAIPGLDGGIPGLDLVGSKEDENNPNLHEDVNDSDVIDLDNDGPSRPAKLAATPSNIASILPSTEQKSTKNLSMLDPGSRQQAPFMSSQSQQRKIPSLFDIVVEKPVLSPELECRNKSPDRGASPAVSKSSKIDIEPDAVENRSRSISKDRDVLASPSQRPLSQLSSMSQRQQLIQNNVAGSNEPPNNQPFSNEQSQQPLHPQAADLAKALQDPNVMQLLTVALAQAQQAGGINPGGNMQQNQLLQQLQQLQPLLQMQQDRNSNINQSWNNSQSQRPQPWQNQNANSNPNQNRNSWGGNPFNRNDQSTSNRNDQLPLNRIDQLSFNRSDQLSFNRNDQLSLNRNDQLALNRGPGSENDSDGNNDMQQRNPHNPFRRSFGGGLASGSGDSSSGGKNFGRNVGGPGGNNPFNMNNTMGLSNDTFNAQQQRGGNFGIGGRFDNNRPLSNFGNSLGFRNNANNFGDRGGDDNDYYRPAQVFDYQNRSRADTMVPPAKVVDYGHRPSADLTTNSFNRDISEFVPVKTIDYGHASNTSSAQIQNQFEQKKSNSKNQTSRWNQDQQSNQDQFPGPIQSHSREQILLNNDSSENIQNKSGFSQNTQQQKLMPNEVNKQINKTTDDGGKKQNSLVDNEDVTELDDENPAQYPNNKWILQNPESRQRPGPPTKRGKRNPNRFKVQHQESPQQYATSECDEIEENFEEISDTEEINEMHDSPLKSKSKHLFPSVSNSIANAPVVFPSMENNNTIPIDEILFKPGRLTRPKNIVIIIRGPPGSGKSHVAKLIKDKEVEMGGPTPRLLSIDDYFMIENDYEEKCPKTGRKIPKKEILYEYEKEMEDTYMQYLIKSFKKTITDHLFDFIIVDCCNQSLRTFNEFYNAARDGNFSPFVVDMICDLEVCLDQNIHSRKEEDIRNIIKNYQECPGHYIKLDVSNLLENVVEMEDVSDLEDNFVADSEVIDLEDEEEDAAENDGGGFLKSKWDTDPTTENLARLDGTSKPMSKRGTATLEEYLQIDGWEPPSSSTDGKKRVRWADIEEKRAQDKMRAIGFVVGQTDWNRMMDPTSGSGALTKTKFIERLNKRR